MTLASDGLRKEIDDWLIRSIRRHQAYDLLYLGGESGIESISMLYITDYSQPYMLLRVGA